jgi:hypothetical protein
MKITLSDKIIAYMALLSGLTISAVAVWYSVAGLVSIFAAAVTPIIVMGVALEISKLIATVWLKLNWQRAPFFIKAYMSAAVAVLMVITSMGIFGFLSKAHSDQSLVSGDVQSRIAVYDEKIKTAKENIDANRKALKQMDEAVDQSMARSTSETGADKAVAIRRGQAKERARLQNEIAAEQKTINKLSEERAPIAAEVRKVEAEVGPIKYIAAFVYGDNPDANVLEKAVTWVIIIIVSVFDPLAVILLLASQYSFQWFRKAREEEDDDLKEVKEWFEQGKERARQLDAEAANTAKFEDIEDPIVDEIGKPAPEPEIDYSKHAYLNPEKSFWHKPEGWEEVPPQVYKPEPVQEPVVEEPVVEVVIEDDDEDEIDESVEMKAAKAAWKHDHPTDSLKRHRKLFEQGLISTLPWESYLSAQPDYTDKEAAEEALKWAQEQIAERPGDYLTPSDDPKKKVTTWIERDGDKQITKSLEDEGYVQNAEQSSSTIWNRVKKAKGD